MIPLSYFLIAWLVFLGLYAIMSFISVIQMVRFGIAGSGTYLSTVLFLCVAFLVIFGTGWFLIGTDWTQGVNAFSWLEASPVFGQ